MKFCTLISEVHLSQKFYHGHTMNGIIQKLSNRIQDIPKHLNPSKMDYWKFLREQKFLHFR